MKIPKQLRDTQKWFGSIIARPIDRQSKMNPISPSGQPMEQEAALYIAPSPTLQSAERIELYNQQYWWRLVSTMQELFPLVTRLFGYDDFNHKLAVPYLDKYPPDHWSLNHLGDRFPYWLELNHKKADCDLVINAALIDWAYNDAFFAAQQPILALEDMENVMQQKMTLQTHVHLFELSFDLFKFREQFLLQEPEYWIENDFPELRHADQGKAFYFILYRNRNNQIAYEEISQSEYQALLFFRDSVTIEELCNWIENEPSDSNLSQDASEKFHFWVQKWIAYQWLGKSVE